MARGGFPKLAPIVSPLRHWYCGSVAGCEIESTCVRWLIFVCCDLVVRIRRRAETVAKETGADSVSWKNDGLHTMVMGTQLIATLGSCMDPQNIQRSQLPLV